MTDKIVSISAMITALIAVVIGVVELQTNREFQRLSVEPYIELSNSNRDGYERLLLNTGLGPARIMTIDVAVDGTRVYDWAEVVRLLTGDEDTSIFYSGLWEGRQIRSEEMITLVKLDEEETAKSFFANSSRMTMTICYCSIYKDCWIKENRTNPQPIDYCPAESGKLFPGK